MVIAVIFAGGTGSRMHSKDKPKQFLDLFHKPIIIHTLEHFDRHPEVNGIVIACLEELIGELQEMIHAFHINKVMKIVPGGKTGQLSIYNGLCAARDVAVDPSDTIVMVHDGVRPMITDALISENIRCVKKHGSAITTGRVTETILEIEPANGRIHNVPERGNSRVAKAPQSFRLTDIMEAHEKARAEGRDDFIDCCTLLSHYGYPLTLVDGSHQNIKITTQEDYYLMRAMLEAQENEQLYSASEW